MSSPVKDTVQSMIDSNAGMVFFYTHSRPELKRMVHPILIVGNHVMCVESDTGLHKRFKLDGIRFPPSNDTDEVREISVEDIIREHVTNKRTFYFKFNNEEIAAIPNRVTEGMMVTGSGKFENWYLIDNIKPIFKKRECEGCLNECANQQGHMGFGGCLSDEPKIVSKTHAWDCGYGWNYDEDRCECGERGLAHCWFDDGHKELLDWM